MKHTIQFARSPQGERLDDETLGVLRKLLAEYGSARQLSVILGASAGALERAAAGGNILKGTRALILAGLQLRRADTRAPGVRR